VKFFGQIRRENQRHVLCSTNFFPSLENRTVYQMMWKNIVQPNRPHMTV